MSTARMDGDRWKRLQTLFHAAADLPADDRRAFLARECTDDPSLIEETLDLLRADEADVSLLRHDIGTIAGQVLGGRPVPPGRRIGPYRITRLLGEGGMGVVFLGERDDLHALAAIKVLRDAWLSPERRVRFAAEQRTLAQLNHPLIARLYDADTLEDGTPWIAMEYVEGRSLAAHVAAEHPSAGERLRLFRDVCRAVQHAHARLIIHRDLKPSNILVTADGNVKLLDFGVAKQLDADGAAGAAVTRTGTRFLTPAYAAPEQFRGEGVGTHTDVYALGVILYELIAGRPPFDLADKSSSEVEAIITQQDPPRPSDAARERTFTRAEWSDIDVLCLTAMHKDPARRYPSVEALLRDLERFTDGRPLEARPDTFGYRVGKFVRRRRAAVLTAAAVLVALTSLVTIYTVRLTAARNDAIMESERALRIQRFTLGLFEGDDPVNGPADSLRVATLVDRGLREASVLAAEPAVQADLYLTLAGIYSHLGQRARADSLLRLALAQRQTVYGPDHIEVAGALVAYGEFKVEDAEVAAADSLIRAGLAMVRRHADPLDHRVVDALAALGRALQEKGAARDAIPVLEEVVALDRARGASEEERALHLFELGEARYYNAEYDTADSLFTEVLRIRRAQLGDRHPWISRVLMNLGSNQHDRGNYAEAAAHYRQAIAITREHYGENSHQHAGNLNQLGRTLLALGEAQAADSALQRALAIRERVFGRNHPLVASTVNEVAGVALNAGRLDEAERLYTRMRDIYLSLYGRSHPFLGVAISNIGGVAFRRGDYARADLLLREALHLFATLQGPEHPNTAIARIKLGRSLIAQRRFAAGEAESRAGYDILVKLTNPSLGFLQIARRDLASAYDALGRADQATAFRTEFVAESTRAAGAQK